MNKNKHRHHQIFQAGSKFAMKIKFTSLIVILLSYSKVSIAFDTSEHYFNYSLGFYQKQCLETPARIKTGLSLALKRNFNGMKLLKQDAKKGVSVVNDPLKPDHASIYFVTKELCEDTLSNMIEKGFM